MIVPHRLLCAAALGLVLPACSGGGTAEPVARPNVLLISIDTLRADHLSCYGYERKTTPNLDALAAEGVRFERCLATTSWTLPSHLSMLTGLAPSAHGIDDDRHWNRLDEAGAPISPDLRGRFVSEALSESGYDCGGFYTWKYLDDRFGFGAGFDTWDRHGYAFYNHPVVGPQFEAAREAGDRDAMFALSQEHPELFDAFQQSTPETLTAAEGWLDAQQTEDADDPFFLFVHLFDVHDPYTSPEPFHSMFDPDYVGPIIGTEVMKGPVHPKMAPRDLHNLISRYDGGIRNVDDELGRFFEQLEARGLADDTLVIVTSDHGEEFFEHGGKSHRSSLYLESIAVPLIIRWPAGIEGGRAVAGNVGLIDIAPTICAATGVELGARVSGRDLLPIARGSAPNERQGYLSELTLFPEDSQVPIRQASLVRENEQVVFRTQGLAPWALRLLDLTSDPNGAGPGRGLAEGEEHARWLGRLADWISALRSLRQDLPKRSGDMRPLTAAERDELAAGGYSSGGDIVTEGNADRLPLEGGVWPDE